MSKNIDLDRLRRAYRGRPTLPCAHAMVVLRALQRHNGQTTDALMAHEHLTRSQLTRAVRVARDMISREPMGILCFKSLVPGSAWKYWLTEW